LPNFFNPSFGSEGICDEVNTDLEQFLENPVSSFKRSLLNVDGFLAKLENHRAVHFVLAKGT